MLNFRKTNIDYQKYSPINAKKQEIFDFAEELANKISLHTGNSLNETVKLYGGRIHYIQSWEEWVKQYEEGTIYVHGQSDFDIVLASFYGPLRDRFTIAHELGHYFLHSRMGKIPIIVNRKGSDRVESEANWFASSFLMPAKEFENEYKNNSSVSYLSSKFLVSKSAIEYKIKNMESKEELWKK